MSEEIKVIPKSILDKKKRIEDMLKQEGCIGVVLSGGRQSGRRFLRDLIFNTEDAEIIEPKQLTNKTTT